MNYIKLIFFFIVVFNITVDSQSDELQKSQSKSQKDLPSVFLTFEKLDKFDLPCSKNKQDGIWLRLHNNSPWAINLDAEPIMGTDNKTSLINLMDGTEVNGLSDGVAVTACYDVEAVTILLPKKKGNTIILDSPLRISVPKIEFYCNCKLRDTRTQFYKGVWVNPGNSVLISVPRNSLAKNLRIYTLFHYDWESVNGLIKQNEPHHKVFFYASDLPDNL